MLLHCIDPAHCSFFFLWPLNTLLHIWLVWFFFKYTKLHPKTIEWFIKAMKTIAKTLFSHVDYIEFIVYALKIILTYGFWKLQTVGYVIIKTAIFCVCHISHCFVSHHKPNVINQDVFYYLNMFKLNDHISAFC